MKAHIVRASEVTQWTSIGWTDAGEWSPGWRLIEWRRAERPVQLLVLLRRAA